MFCDIADVEKQLGRPAGSAWSSDDISQSIEDATIDIKTKLVGGAVDQDTLDDWDSGDAPNEIRLICARLAAADVLEKKSNQSTSDRTTKAAGLQRKAENALNDILNKKTALFDSDNAKVSTFHQGAKVTTSGQTPHFTMGNTGNDSEGTLDGF